jgi:dTDP-glucose 4,6-dehydratase
LKKTKKLNFLYLVQAHLDTSFGNSVTFTESNVYGTHSVLEAARIYGRIQKFIHLSTDEVYGGTIDGSYQETSLLNPINPYAATIAAAEFLVKSYGESFKLSYCIIRLSNVYGPRQHIEKLIPTFINNLLQDEKLKIHGDGKQIRHYLYIDDVINAIDIILNKGKTKMIYNIGTENGFSVLDIAKKLLEYIQPDKKLEDVVKYVKPRSFTEKRYSTTSSGAAKTLGWKAQVSFDEGLQKTIQWYKQNQNYWIK